MKTLYIQPTLNSPEVNFDCTNATFKISGQSIHTNVQEFYNPVIAYLERLVDNPPESLTFHFSLNYYNLASAKRFMFIIFLLSKMKFGGSLIKIEWEFFKDDDFMREFGEDLSDNFDVPLELVASKKYARKVKMAS